MSMTRVQIDLNAELANGLTMVPLTDVEGEVEPGKMVRVFEPEDGVEGDALLEKVNHEVGYAFVRVNWESIHDVSTASSTRFADIVGAAREAAGLTRAVISHGAWGGFSWSRSFDSNVLAQNRVTICA